MAAIFKGMCFIPIAATKRVGLIQALDGMWKNVANLVEADLVAAPVWEWRDDGGLAVVQPASVELTERSGQDPIYVAATRYVAANGLEFFGYCSPTDSSGLDYTQPVALTRVGPMPLWAEKGLSSTQVHALADALGIDSNVLFPFALSVLSQLMVSITPMSSVPSNNSFKPNTLRGGNLQRYFSFLLPPQSVSA